jgi:hypothetical protein
MWSRAISPGAPIVEQRPDGMWHMASPSLLPQPSGMSTRLRQRLREIRDQILVMLQPD